MGMNVGMVVGGVTLVRLYKHLAGRIVGGLLLRAGLIFGGIFIHAVISG